MEEFLAFGLVVRGIQLFRSTREDSEMRRRTPPRALDGLTYVHEALACLVNGVYARDKGEENPDRYWQSVQYEPLEPNDLHLGDEEARNLVAIPQAPYARLMLYRRVKQGPNGGSARKLRLQNEPEDAQYVHWPLYVVAIRGTILTRLPDLCDDGKILFENICKTVALYKPVERLLTAIHRQYGRDVWVTGHSLGGVLGLIATRRLALNRDQPIILDAHFFNTPNISLDAMAKKLFRGSVNGLAAGTKKIWVVGGPASTAIRGLGALAINSAEWVSRRSLEALFPRAFQRAGEHFQTLRIRQYIPHLYVNPRDSFCNEYIQHFQGDQPPPVSNAVAFSQFFIDTESCHLIPQAYLHTNHWASGLPEAHKLHQWFRYPLVNLTSELVGAP